MAEQHSLPSGTVTFLFTDIEGSTQMWERDPSAMRQALEDHDEIVQGAISRHAGEIFKTGGDAFCAVFADPHQALTAALQAQRSLNEHHWPTDAALRVRMGIHTGTAQLRGADYFGPTLNRVARVMAAGHGGQTLLSAATYRLTVDAAPDDVDFVDLGTFHLRDLDRPEEIFQMAAPGLQHDFPPLRDVGQEGAGPKEAALAAYQAKRWQETVDLLEDIERHQPLEGRQHHMFADALWWLGRHEELPQRFESAYNTYLAEGALEQAARTAVELAEIHYHRLSPDVSRAWERRAQKTIEGLEGTAADGYLTRWQAVRAFEIEGDTELGLNLAKRVMEIAKRNEDGNLETLSLQDQGRMLVARGEVAEGMALMDEAMVAAVAGDVSPVVVGRSYCNMLAVCDTTGDVRRATEWSQTAQRWCEESEQAPYPGVCRIFKAEILWRAGDWVTAESEVLRATNELGALMDVAGEALYHYGEMRLRSGDLEGAEKAFQDALTRGREPVPGYALLLNQRGQSEVAVEILERALHEPTTELMDRARVLPALIDILFDSNRLDEARTWISDFEEVASRSGSDLFGAQLDHRRGRAELLGGDPKEAIPLLKQSLRAFRGLGLPFESALVHADLGSAYRADGLEPLAAMETKAAVSELQRLGAVTELARIHGQALDRDGLDRGVAP